MSAPGSRRRSIARIVRLLRAEADRRMVWAGLGTVLLVVAGGALSALSPLVMKSLVDAVAAPRQSRLPSGALPCGIAYLLVLLAGRLLADVRPLLTGSLLQRLHGRLTQRFFDHVLRLPLVSLHRRRGGELLHGLDLSSAGVQLIVTHLTGSVLPVVVELCTMITVLVRLGQPALVAVFGVAALAYLVIFTAGARLMATAAHAVSASSLEVHARLGDSLAHVETLRAFGAEPQTRRRLGEAVDTLEHRWRGLHRLNAGIALSASMTFGVAMAASLLIGADAVARQAMTLGGFVLTTVYVAQMVRPLESLGTAARDLSRSLGYVQPLLDLLAEPPSADCTGVAGSAAGAPTAPAPRRRAPAVRLENLHFGYDPRRPVLKGVDLDVPAGSTTAIVGRSGSGKSSLARLLLRLHAPQQGRILLDGRAIDSIAVTELRGTVVGLVAQETALLHESIAANIALGTPSATRDDLRRAVRAAQLEAVVDALPDGLDTPVGERGLQLSGGERQRVGIARAFLRRPRLVVLDEPTSMLDSKTEREIQHALRALCADATTIVIAHRLSTIVHADEIVVLEGGRISERGSHHALLARNGLYAQMWRQQMAGPVDAQEPCPCDAGPSRDAARPAEGQ